jgi:hypothetical protein
MYFVAIRNLPVVMIPASCSGDALASPFRRVSQGVSE